MCIEAFIAHKCVTRETEGAECQLLLAVAAGCFRITASFSDEQVKKTLNVKICRKRLELVSLRFADIILAKWARDCGLVWPTSSNIFETLTTKSVKTRRNFRIPYDI